MAEKVPADPRVTALGLIIKLTDDVFKAPDFDSAASLIVNSSHSLLRFKSAVLVELGREKNQVIAQYGQTELYPHTEQAQLQKAVAQSIDFSENNTLLLTKESLSDMEGKGADALAQLLDGDDPILVYKMAPPAFIGDPGFYFVWMLEFSGDIPDYAKNSSSVLARNFAQALFSRRCCSKAGKLRSAKWNKWIIRGIIALAVLIAITVMGGLFGIPGMIFGVPIFAVVIEMCKRGIEDKLRGKDRETDTTHYYRKGAVGNAEEEVYYEHAHWKYKYDHSRIKPHVDKFLAALIRLGKKLTGQSTDDAAEEENPADTTGRGEELGDTAPLTPEDGRSEETAPAEESVPAEEICSEAPEQEIGSGK